MSDADTRALERAALSSLDALERLLGHTRRLGVPAPLPVRQLRADLALAFFEVALQRDPWKMVRSPCHPDLQPHWSLPEFVTNAGAHFYLDCPAGLCRGAEANPFLMLHYTRRTREARGNVRLPRYFTAPAIRPAWDRTIGLAGPAQVTAARNVILAIALQHRQRGYPTIATTVRLEV